MMETKEEILKKTQELYEKYVKEKILTDFFETLSFISSLIKDKVSSLTDALSDTRVFFGNPFMETEEYEEFEDMLCKEDVSSEIIFYIISEVKILIINDLINKNLTQDEVNILLSTLDDKYLNSSISNYSRYNSTKIKEYYLSCKFKTNEYYDDEVEYIDYY